MSIVIVRLIGGLGNQMFQYAAGRSLSDSHHVPLLLDISGFEQYDLRRYELGGFNIRGRSAHLDELNSFGPSQVKPSLFFQVLEKVGIRKYKKRLQEASFSYDSRILTVKPPVYLDGYWQSERYFSHIESVLRSEFSLKEKLTTANADMVKQITSAGECAVSVHIRRGDYVTNPHTAQYHGVCSLDYYRTAVSYIAERVSQPHFFIFSDDHDWVLKNFDIDYQMTLVQVNDANQGIYDLHLMKACRHHIIANSSFSWWGAWLNPSSEKIVLAPKRWFASSGKDTSDLLPASWVRL
ncbi:MAG: alpha-1,2-fucosyltransferase [Chlorobium sp.]|nr:alpha-1,2-fucosyltransferase [Chlorobium sp.]